MKTATYRTQANLTERVNRNLVQMIACFVKENHENKDRFLHEFAFTLRTSVTETINKTPAELFLGRKIITRFSRLINVTESAEYVERNIEKLFNEARQNMRKQHKHWGKYYNRKRREVSIKVNDLVLVQTHFISAAGRRVVGKFMPKFEGPYRVLKVQNNNLIILKRGKRVTVNIDQVRVYRPRQSDTIGSDSQGSEHRNQKRPTPEPKQEIKRAIPSSVSSRNYKYRRPNNHSQRSQPIAGPSHQQDSRQEKSPTVASRHEGSGQYSKAWETKTTKNRTNRAAERRTVRPKQTIAVKPCPSTYAVDDYCDEENIQHLQIATGVPRGNGQVERIHRTLIPVLTKLSLDDSTKCCQVIYSQFGLAIHQNDHQARRRFVECAQNEIAVVPDFHKRILFSDEAHFWLNCYVNKQNCRIWSEANPQVYVETPLHPEKLTVWCTLWAGGILLQKR
ncbi:uncharacterized protein TNCV_4088811 [Trichonephila clavipes]|nr:uncharacterized protein TNCV_4088811 [Trichonephila clavipes]